MRARSPALGCADGSGAGGGRRLDHFHLFVGDLAPEVNDKALYEFFNSKTPNVSYAPLSALLGVMVGWSNWWL